MLERRLRRSMAVLEPTSPSRRAPLQYAFTSVPPSPVGNAVLNSLPFGMRARSLAPAGRRLCIALCDRVLRLALLHQLRAAAHQRRHELVLLRRRLGRRHRSKAESTSARGRVRSSFAFLTTSFLLFSSSLSLALLVSTLSRDGPWRTPVDPLATLWLCLSLSLRRGTGGGAWRIPFILILFLSEFLLSLATRQTQTKLETLWYMYASAIVSFHISKYRGPV